MTFKVGDGALSKDDGYRGKVTLVKGEDITVQFTDGTAKVYKAEQLEASYIGGVKNEALEVAQNTLFYALENAILKKGAMGKDTIEFLVEDAVVQFVANDWLSFLEIMDVKATESEGFLDMQDVRDVVNQSLKVTLLDCLYKVAMSRAVLNTGTLKRVLKVFVACYLGNMTNRKFWDAREGAYTPLSK